MRREFSFFHFSKDKEDNIITEATQEFDWVGNRASVSFYYDDEEYNSWRVIGVARIGNKFIDYDEKLNHPRDWINALQWLIVNEEG